VGGRGAAPPVTIDRAGVTVSRYRRTRRDAAWGCDPLVTIDDVRSFATSLPRTTEGLVRDRVKFRVGRIVYVAFSRDETVMGFGFPKEEREALVRSEPEKFMMPERSDLRYHWVQVRLDAIDDTEMRELVSTRGGCACPRRWRPRTKRSEQPRASQSGSRPDPPACLDPTIVARVSGLPRQCSDSTAIGVRLSR